MKIIKQLSTCTLFFSCFALGSVSFEAPRVSRYQLVEQISTGTGATYVTFKKATLTGCAEDKGGYLQPTWAEAMGGEPKHHEGDRMLSLLLTAKATNSEVFEVVYHVNKNGTGRNKCAISSITIK
ncbi:hypothetical protein [Pseudoalteromonas rubra]|uniref:Uncharacterized protein n=1 Tax=Pseudoalteromonas rubra TaxID=43658 RepID=A0A0F4QK26_9GAMM|nr:hypothetical protein [Pseudoalteromonas rubra]KJZ07679.1 hypothetical protein TW77_14325 [Pseudoalteromonas rubra]